MLELTKLDEIKLADAIDQWFNQNQINFFTNKNFWVRNPVAAVIKRQLKSKKKWKNGRRGKAIPGQWTQKNPEDNQNW
jgi:hypothetical protein